MKQEETALVLEVIRSFKEFLENTELSANEDASRALRTKVEFFKKVTSEFVETTEAMENWFKYINSIIVCLPARVDWPDARAWILKMVDKFIMDKIIDAEAFIIEFTSNMVQDNETILIYGYSTLMHSLIVNIHEKKHNVSIIYANEVENKTGQEFVAKLASKGVQVDCI
jgi:translation initiation factor 2B subunit (eIF-2B alpha/beta/delta family)